MGRPQWPSRKGLGKEAIDRIPIRKEVCSCRTRGSRQIWGPLVLSKQSRESLHGVCFNQRLPGLQQGGGRMGEKEEIAHNEKFKLHPLLERGWPGTAGPTKRQCGLATVRGNA